MAIGLTDSKHYEASADVIRERLGIDEKIKPEEIADRIDDVYDAGYNGGLVEGEEQGYDDGYTDGWDFGESSGTKDGFEVGVGLGEGVQPIVVGTLYGSPDIEGRYSINIDNPKHIVITVTDSFDINILELIDATGNITDLADPQIRLEEAGTYTFEFPDGFVCNDDDGYGEIYLEGSYNGIVGVSVTSKTDGGYDEGFEAVLAEQDALIEELSGILDQKASGDGTELDPRDLYQRVEYITTAEEDTYPYVITDICADNNTGMEVVASFPSMADRIPMGSREDSSNTRFYVAYPLSTSSVYYGFNSGASISCSTKVNTIYRLQTNFLNSRLVCVYEENGTRKVNGSIDATLTAHSAPIAIFGYNSASAGVVQSKREFKLYSARISRGHDVVREYIPCYRKEDGEVGLYEKFSGTFLTAEGGGAFTKGPDVEWGDI